jgi:hypothetical protein
MNNNKEIKKIHIPKCLKCNSVRAYENTKKMIKVINIKYCEKCEEFTEWKLK